MTALHSELIVTFPPLRSELRIQASHEGPFGLRLSSSVFLSEPEMRRKTRRDAEIFLGRRKWPAAET